MQLRLPALFVASALLASFGMACSPSTGDGGGFSEHGGAGQGGASVGGGKVSNPGGDTGLVIDNGGRTGVGASGNDGPDGSCVALPFSAEHVITTTNVPTTTTETQPIDIFIMFDQSLSMTCSIPSGGDRWAAAVTAVQGFVQQQPASAGVSVGINYFGNSVASSCDAATFETPAVEIGPLPQNASALVSSLNGHKPVSNTPTAAGLSGAINHALPWKVSHPNDVVVVVLVTDGQPNACGAVSDVATVARVGWGTGAGVRTFVVGITSVGTSCGLDPNPPNVPDLNSVASAGGTDKAIVIDATANPVKQLTDALNQIRQSITTTKTVTKTEVHRTKVACQFTIPAPPVGQTFDRDKVNIEVTGSAGAKSPVYKVASLADCASTSGYAWYYDNPSAPTQILVCPSTCTQIQKGDLSADAAAGGDPLVDVLLGCATKIAIR